MEGGVMGGTAESIYDQAPGMYGAEIDLREHVEPYGLVRQRPHARVREAGFAEVELGQRRERARRGDEPDHCVADRRRRGGFTYPS